MQFIKVKISEGEKIRLRLTNEGLINPNYKIVKKGESIFFPVKKPVKGFKLVQLKGEKFHSKPKNLKDALKNLLTKKQLEELTTSFDIIGDIAIIEIPGELATKEKQIAQALLSVHKNLKVVAKKLGAMEGEFRVRPLKVIGGENRTVTTYKESGCSIRLDLAKVYFSVRLSFERSRLAKLIKPKEKVLVAFAGVGPFALVIGKSNQSAEITAIELNPAAVGYMEENVYMNKLKNISPLLGDVNVFLQSKFPNYFDRVIMPLPHSAELFLGSAFKAIKNNGIIHFYTIVPSQGAFEEGRKKVLTEAGKSKVKIEFLNERIVRPYSPKEVQVVLDFKVIGHK
ncbi:class I SAM-dependent methyltransferase family protein [Candidatus Micrarchaeota archaeon]|nr:class I SAM-dependent methyltransferase family protein [Candidatus Micrarchaeota archaeon]